MEKAYMTQRLLARIIDIIIVSIITALFSIVTSPIINTKAIEKLNKELTTSFEEYQDKKIDLKTYTNQSRDISYQLAKLDGLNQVISIIIVVVYYIVFQVYNKGQTLGRKIMKTKVVKIDESELTINDMIIREMFNYAIIVNIILLVVTLLGKNVYILSSTVISYIQILFMVITAFMILIRKDGRGLPDMFSKTEVINIGNNKEV